MNDERQNDGTGHDGGRIDGRPEREKMLARRVLLQAGFALPLAAMSGMARKTWGQGHHAAHYDHHDHHAASERGTRDRLAVNHYDHHDHHVNLVANHYDHHDHHIA